LEKVKAFIVDDELHSRELLSYFLMLDREFEVIGYYADALKVLDDICKYKPDVVFTDVSMPVMNGIELARQIKTNCPGVDIVFISAFADYEEQASKIEHSGFLLKPFELNELMLCKMRVKSNVQMKIS
jgi:YesN/AraC family two-component response regulator